jgi:hypothetical protein
MRVLKTGATGLEPATSGVTVGWPPGRNPASQAGFPHFGQSPKGRPVMRIYAWLVHGFGSRRVFEPKRRHRTSERVTIDRSPSELPGDHECVQGGPAPVVHGTGPGEGERREGAGRKLGVHPPKDCVAPVAREAPSRLFERRVVADDQNPPGRFRQAPEPRQDVRRRGLVELGDLRWNEQPRRGLPPPAAGGRGGCGGRSGTREAAG